MSKQAVGILETKGLTALVQEYEDAILKAANVELTGPMKGVGSALVNSIIKGDVAAVKAAIEAGAEAAREYGKLSVLMLLPAPRGHRDHFPNSAKKSARGKK